MNGSNGGSIGSGSGQFIIGTTPGNPNMYFTLNFQNDINGNPDYTNPLPLKLGWLLGFRNGIYTGNIKHTRDSMAVPDGVGRWMSNKGKHLYGLWKEGVFTRFLRDSGTPVIAKNN